MTLVRAGLPILKGLDLLADRLTDPKLGRYIQAVRDEVKTGSALSEAFGRQNVFPPIYVTSVLAGEKSGALTEVLDRYITYQKLTLAVRKKLLVSLLYPAVLIVLVVALIVFLVTYVVPSFAALYNSMEAKLPFATQILIAVGTTARSYVLAGAGALVVARGGNVFLGAARELAGNAGPYKDAYAAAGRNLDQVSSGAVGARAGNAADRRHSAGAGARNDGPVARNGADEESAR